MFKRLKMGKKKKKTRATDGMKMIISVTVSMQVEIKRSMLYEKLGIERSGCNPHVC